MSSDPHSTNEGHTPHPPADPRPSICLFFPVYNDQISIEELTRKASRILSEVACRHEIIMVNDGSKDNSGAIADQLAREIPHVRVVHHPQNKGYGQALQTGFREAGDFDWICFTDGDHQYDVSEIRRFVPWLTHYDMVLGFRVSKVYSPFRKLLSWGLNVLVRALFGTPYRDVTCGFKMIRKEATLDLSILSKNVFAGGEIVMRSAFKGCHIGEIAISMYPRQGGRSSVTSWKIIWQTFQDVLRVRQELYQNRPRGPG